MSLNNQFKQASNLNIEEQIRATEKLLKALVAAKEEADRARLGEIIKISQVTSKMDIMRNVVRNLQWKESDNGLYETSKTLTPYQRERIFDLMGSLQKAGRLTAYVNLKAKQIQTEGVNRQVHDLIFSIEDLVAFGDVVDFEKIQRLQDDNLGQESIQFTRPETTPSEEYAKHIA